MAPPESLGPPGPLGLLGPLEELTTDCLIVGGGGAGVMAALHAHDADPRLDITVVVKGLVAQSGCTRMVQGGYNAVLDPRDSFAAHFGDTVRGGGFLNDQELAWTLVREAPVRLLELENRYGCFFDRHPDGVIHQKPFAGQSFDRTVHRGDLTGIEIMGRLKDQLFARRLRRLEEHRALELVPAPGGGAVAGALLLDMRRGAPLLVRARAVLLATGGGATMYRIAAPSLEKAGDGVAMAWRAGARLMDLEMMQFHPTGLLAGRSRLTGSVLEEGLRGAGAHLRNAAGERYMARYDPERLERSTRDVVSRSGYQEIMAGRGTPSGGVWIDVSHLGAANVRRQFPGMVERCLAVGVDLATEPVEVSPTAHFHMGGIAIDADGRTSLEGLFAAGEDAAGVHGANRLGGNGVAESIVFGARAGEAMAAYVAGRALPAADTAFAVAAARAALAPLAREGGADAFALRERLGVLTWEQVGLVRDAAGLRAARSELDALYARAGEVAVNPERRLNGEWQQALDVRNLIEVARLIARAALLREESRGSHFRADFPRPDDARWLTNICLRGPAWGGGAGGGADGEVALRPVRPTRLAPPVAA
jgi:succinate dehydrogenase / fumarate reductase flavoprotein subunit/fumarate reductase flavoprotein subunit